MAYIGLLFATLESITSDIGYGKQKRQNVGGENDGAGMAIS